MSDTGKRSTLPFLNSTSNSVLPLNCGLAARRSAGQHSSVVKRLENYHQQRYGLSLDWFTFPDSAIAREEPFREVPCRS